MTQRVTRRRTTEVLTTGFHVATNALSGAVVWFCVAVSLLERHSHLVLFLSMLSIDPFFMLPLIASGRIYTSWIQTMQVKTARMGHALPYLYRLGAPMWGIDNAHQHMWIHKSAPQRRRPRGCLLAKSWGMRPNRTFFTWVLVRRVVWENVAFHNHKVVGWGLGVLL